MKIVKPIVFRNFDFTRASPATYYGSDGILETAMVNVLRLGYNPSTLDFIGPIIENAAINQIESNIQNDDYWEWSGLPGAIDFDAIDTDPDGSAGVYTLRDRGRQNAVSKVDSVFSVFAKVGDSSASNVLMIRHFNIAAQFDLAAGIVTFTGAELLAANIEALPDGWYRCSTAITAAAGFSADVTLIPFNSGTGGAVRIFGPQLEAITDNLKPTSYIYTTDGPETRAADITVEEPPRVVTSNVEEDDAPLWDEDENYVADDPAMVLGQVHKVFRSIGINIDKYPPEHPDEWIDEGATNRWRMFDMSVGIEKQTVSTNSSNTVEVLLELNQVVTAVALLNMEANNVRVIMRDQYGEIVYEHYEDLLQSTPSSDWWSFFFATRSNIKTLVLTDLPSVVPSTIEMILDGDAFPAKIGKMIVGEAVDIGCARYGTSVGIVDFSRKERDPFGNNFILERRYIDRADYDVQILTGNIDNVKALLTSIRATPALYIGDEQFASTIIYGFYRDFSIVISGPRRSDATIQVESI